MLADFVGVAYGVGAVEFEGDTSRRQERSEHFEGGGFSRAVRTEESEDFAFGDVEGDVVDGGEVVEFSDQILHADHEESSSTKRVRKSSRITFCYGKQRY